MPSPHQLAYALKHSPELSRIESLLGSSSLPQEAKRQAIAAYHHLAHRALQGEPDNTYWFVLVAEACGLREIRIEPGNVVVGINRDGEPLRFPPKGSTSATRRLGRTYRHDHRAISEGGHHD